MLSLLSSYCRLYEQSNCVAFWLQETLEKADNESNNEPFESLDEVSNMMLEKGEKHSPNDAITKDLNADE